MDREQIESTLQIETGNFAFRHGETSIQIKRNQFTNTKDNLGTLN